MGTDAGVEAAGISDKKKDKNGKRSKILIAIFLITAVLAGCLLWQWQESEKRSREAVSLVSVRTETNIGQGVIYEQRTGQSYIVTSGHVMEGMSLLDSCTVIIGNGEERQATVCYLSDVADVAFLSVEFEEGKAVKTDRASFDSLKEGDSLYALCFNGEEVSRAEGILRHPWIYLEDFSLNMMLAQLPCEKGMSGCGVFDEEGNFIGIVCGMDSEGEVAILPFSVIESEWMWLNKSFIGSG